MVIHTLADTFSVDGPFGKGFFDQLKFPDGVDRQKLLLSIFNNAMRMPSLVSLKCSAGHFPAKTSPYAIGNSPEVEKNKTRRLEALVQEFQSLNDPNGDSRNLHFRTRKVGAVLLVFLEYANSNCRIPIALAGQQISTPWTPTTLHSKGSAICSIPQPTRALC